MDQSQYQCAPWQQCVTEPKAKLGGQPFAWAKLEPTLAGQDIGREWKLEVVLMQQDALRFDHDGRGVTVLNHDLQAEKFGFVFGGGNLDAHAVSFERVLSGRKTTAHGTDGPACHQDDHLEGRDRERQRAHEAEARAADHRGLWYTAARMKLAIPKFQYRFVRAMGNVIHPGNFHPVGTQVEADRQCGRALSGRTPVVGQAGRWLLVGGSGGFGSAARIALAAQGAHTLSVAFDAQPNPESTNKIRMLGSPGFHRNLAIERRLRALGLVAVSHNADAFSLDTRERALASIREHMPGGKIDGLVWALASPRGLDPRTGQVVSSSLRPLGRTVAVKTFGPGDDGEAGPARIAEFAIEPGTPEEAINTQYVMGGRIVEIWIDALQNAGVLAQGFTLVTISYRGNALNDAIYRKGLIGLAKADLEFQTRAIDAVLRKRLDGRAIAVEAPAVVTEASGGIPGVPFYMALLMDTMGARFEDPLASMERMRTALATPGGPTLDEVGRLCLDDRELSPDVFTEVKRRFDAYAVGDVFEERLFRSFMTAYAATRGFDVEGVDYEAEFDVNAVSKL